MYRREAKEPEFRGDSQITSFLAASFPLSLPFDDVSRGNRTVEFATWLLGVYILQRYQRWATQTRGTEKPSKQLARYTRDLGRKEGPQGILIGECKAALFYGTVNQSSPNPFILFIASSSLLTSSRMCSNQTTPSLDIIAERDLLRASDQLRNLCGYFLMPAFS